ncbi:MAG TPA: hypothetical protein VN740_01915 [Solirubrobacteraceae bacterium]|nr:hypothetical protein [Solirubrobacteraceae bacterium]
MILSWALFPLVMAAVGLGWGALVEWAGGERELGALSIPLGLAAAIVVAALFTAFDFSAQAAVPVVAGGALAGLARAWGRARVPAPALIAAVGVLLVYGAPVILSGEASFLGYVRLDDTATWLAFVDQFFAHGRSLASLSTSSTYWLLLNTNLTAAGYPAGAFMLPGIGHWLTGIDAAWIFQPDLAICAGALALCCFELLAPVLQSAWLRSFVAFIAAQSALLFGYAAWGGIKELTAAFLLALGIAVGVRLLARERAGPRAGVPIAVAAAALTVTLGAAAAIYVAPALFVGMTILLWRGSGGRLAVVLLWDVIGVLNVVFAALAFQIVPASVLAFATPHHSEAAGVLLVALDFAVLGWLAGAGRPGQNARRVGGLGVLALAAVLIVVLGASATPYVTLVAVLALVAIALTPPAGARAFLAGAGGPLLALPLTIVLALPAWLTLTAYLPAGNGFTAAGASHETLYGNLVAALKWPQLAGIWLDGDFRSFPYPPISPVLNYLLIWLVLAAAAFALAWTLWKRSIGVALYVAVALVSLATLSLDGAVPWVIGKSLAFASPAVLLAGLAGAAILFSLERVLAVIVGVVLLGAISMGVLWSNYLQFHNVTLAPRARLAELQKIGGMIDGKGPTFFNEYEIYGDRHFLRAGAPVEPAEYRDVNLPTLGNAFLTDSAWADLDSFALSTLRPYRSLVVRIAPTASQPPSIYGERPVWQGRYYQLWQQPAHPTHRVLQHLLLGDNVNDAYCGSASNVVSSPPECPVAPAAVPACSQVRALAATAASDHGELLAYERTNPLVVRGADTVHSGADWYSVPPNIAPVASAGGATATWPLTLPHAVAGYRLWLGGTFQRGFTVSVDGRTIGSIANQLNPVGAYNQIGAPISLAAGNHTIVVTYRRESALDPGSADTEAYYTELTAIVLAPPASQARYVTVSPAHASELCGRSLDWIEVIAPA